MPIPHKETNLLSDFWIRSDSFLPAILNSRESQALNMFITDNLFVQQNHNLSGLGKDTIVKDLES